MFKPTDSRRGLYFNPSCTWSAEEYRLVGVLVGLAIYNATLLGAYVHTYLMPSIDRFGSPLHADASRIVILLHMT